MGKANYEELLEWLQLNHTWLALKDHLSIIKDPRDMQYCSITSSIAQYFTMGSVT